MKRVASLVALLLLPFASACLDVGTGPGEVEEITDLPRELSVSEMEVIRASNRFAFDLAGRVSHPDSSFFISPLSASMTLGMILNGADGQTREQMADVLGFGDLPESEINHSYRELIGLLRELDPTVELAIGNAVWLREGLQARAPFRSRVEEFFDARVESLDFGSPSAPETINGWASDATNGLIDEIVEPPIPPNVVVYLMNAIYFEGTWTTQFDPDDTAPAPFHRADGSTAEVQMMKADDVEARYDQTRGYVAADLPYGGEAFAMTVVVPSEGWSVDDFVRDLDATGWRALVEGLEEREITVFLPRFEMEYERRLNDDLKAVGMTDAFGGGADFSRMTDSGIFLDEVKQKTFVTVNEEGTEAAAVTSGAGATSAPPTFRADRPFLFVIRERLSGTILFMGAYLEPPG